MSLTFYTLLWIGGGNGLIATTFSLSINAISRALQVLLIVLPPISYWATKRICLGLRRSDEDKLHHGIETGVIQRLPSGEVIEVHAPLLHSPGLILDRSGHDPRELAGNVEHGEPDRLGVGSAESPRRGVVSTAARALGGFFSPSRPSPPGPRSSRPSRTPPRRASASRPAQRWPGPPAVRRAGAAARTTGQRLRRVMGGPPASRQGAPRAAVPTAADVMVGVLPPPEAGPASSCGRSASLARPGPAAGVGAAGGAGSVPGPRPARERGGRSPGRRRGRDGADGTARARRGRTDGSGPAATPGSRGGPTRLSCVR